MSRLSFIPVDSKAGLTDDGILETIEDVKRFLGCNLTPAEQEEIQKALDKIPEEKMAGYTPQPQIDFKAGSVAQTYFPVWRVLSKRRLSKRATGISISVRTRDGYFLGIRRSLKNGSHRGQLGVVAGFMKHFVPDDRTIVSIAIKNTLEELEHEIFLKAIDINDIEVIGVLELDDHDELVVQVKASLNKEEILKKRIVEDQGIHTHIAEESIFFATGEQVTKIVGHPRIAGAPWHLFAFLIPIIQSVDWALAMIQKVKHFGDDEPYVELVNILDELDITARNF